MLDQPMRQTRSMARIPNATGFFELPSTSRQLDQHQSASTLQTATRSPRKARASQAAQLEAFDPESPDVSMAACMESPKKGRFDDFEFELENSAAEVPTRRRGNAPPRRSSRSPSADVGLPPSETCTNLGLSTRSNALLASQKQNSPTSQAEQARANASPVKPVAAVPRASRLHGITPKQSALPSEGSETRSVPRKAVDWDASAAVGKAPTNSSEYPVAESKASTSSRQTSQRLLFGASDAASEASAKRNPFLDNTDSNTLALLGEPRHSPVKRFQSKSELIISSPDRPDRKPINLLELKPSPGKAQRGIFRHNSNHDDEDEDDEWDASGLDTADEIRLVKGPAFKMGKATNPAEKAPSTSNSVPSASSVSSKNGQTVSRSTSTLDVKHTLSSETSDALANLEASLARLKAKTRSPSSAAANEKKENGGDTTLKRELGVARASALTTSRTQIFRARTSINAGDSSFSARSIADQSSDSNVFKRPSGRISALAKSRESSSEHRSSLNPSLASSKSMMSFGAPRLPGYSELGGRPVKPTLSTSRTSSLEMNSDGSTYEEQAAQEEEEARVAEAKRKAELKAAKRKSMSSVLSSGMPPPLQRKEPDTQSSASGNATKSSSSQLASSSTLEMTAAENAEAKKAVKAARRRSLYTYVPTKREDADTDRSIGNISTGLIGGSNISGNLTGADTSHTAKKTRFLRGLTVLVDVRDQDGQDASACWVEMLKGAGAKVLVRFGERKLTHIVYKSGRPSTLHSYRALEDPKPHVVGISWVVACLEQGKKADESPYLVEVAKQAIFATVSCSANTTPCGQVWKVQS